MDDDSNVTRIDSQVDEGDVAFGPRVKFGPIKRDGDAGEHPRLALDEYDELHDVTLDEYELRAIALDLATRMDLPIKKAIERAEAFYEFLVGHE